MGETRAVIERLAAENAKMVDFRFTDLLGRWRHTAIDARQVDDRLLQEGLLVDGSGLPGWRDPNEADLCLRPDPDTLFLDPFAAQQSLVVLCDVAEPGTGLGYARDPRSIARMAETWLSRQGFADRIQIDLEVHGFLFDDFRNDRSAQGPGGAEIGISRAPPDAFRPNPDRATASGLGFAGSPVDRTGEIRLEIMGMLAALGFERVQSDHGAAPMQMRFSFAGGGLVAAADRLQLFKDVVHHVAASYGRTAIFMPKPLARMAGSGLGIALRLWQGERPIFAGQGYADLSQSCLSFIAGVIEHAHAVNALTNPSTNSYRRLRIGAEEPVYLAYAALNRSAAIRIPFAARPDDKAVELRFPDPLANPYLAFSALLLAGLDGIGRQLDPGDAMDRNLYDLPPLELAELRCTARSLPQALDALAADHEFLAVGEVMLPELVEAYLAVKRAEIERIEESPHPAEFALYAGV